MTREEVFDIFQKRKDAYLFDMHPVENPTAYLLGGQGAVGKGALMNKVKNENTGMSSVLSINGDVYRTEHPDESNLKKEPETFSQNTQIFSSVFTEGLINEAISGQFNVVVEGTMRNPETPMKTAEQFRKNGFRVEAYAIAAPGEFSTLNLYTRYANEVSTAGNGRLADKKSHDTAIEGLPISLDALYKEKAVDAIHIYSCFAKEKVFEYTLQNGNWNSSELPSQIVARSREEQKNDIPTILSILERSREIDKLGLPPSIMKEVNKARRNLLNLLAIGEKPAQVFELKDKTLAIRYPGETDSHRLSEQEHTLFKMFQGKEESDLLMPALTRIHREQEPQQMTVSKGLKR